MRIRFVTVLLVALLALSGCVSTKPAATDAGAKASAPVGPTVHLVGTVFMFQFASKNQMTETSPGVFEIVMDTPAPSTESWMADKGASHAVKFVLDKNWAKGYIGTGWEGPMVLDTGMSNLYLNLKEGVKYRYKVDLNAMTYSITEEK